MEPYHSLNPRDNRVAQGLWRLNSLKRRGLHAEDAPYAGCCSCSYGVCYSALFSGLCLPSCCRTQFSQRMATIFLISAVPACKRPPHVAVLTTESPSEKEGMEMPTGPSPGLHPALLNLSAICRQFCPNCTWFPGAEL